MPYCRGCNRLITFVKTNAGKSMPCDPNLKLYKQAKDGKLNERN